MAQRFIEVHYVLYLMECTCRGNGLMQIGVWGDGGEGGIGNVRLTGVGAWCGARYH